MRFRHFVSNRENINYRKRDDQLLLLNSIFENCLKNKSKTLKFLRFYAEINFSRLIRNLQYINLKLTKYKLYIEYITKK